MDYIAERRLLYSKKNELSRNEFSIKISAPYIVQQQSVKFPVDGVMAGCHVGIDGLNERSFEVYGMDSLQAVHLASDIDALLERLGAKYDFFWLTGEPYFDSEPQEIVKR